ncbi:hypothetical protein D3C87_1409710 [compost metagenome]
MLFQRYGRTNFTCQFGAVAQKKEQQVEHDEKAHQKIERALTETEGLGSDKFIACYRTLDDFLSQTVQLADPEPIEQVLEVRRQAVFEMRHVAGDIQFAAFDSLVDRGPFLHQQETEDDHRQNRDHQADAQGEQRRQVALPAEFRLQAALQGGEEDAEDDSPEHRCVERQQNPDERGGDQSQQDHQ